MSQAAPATLRICSFRGLQNLPLYVAAREGFFRREALAIELSYTNGSAPQLGGLARGAFDLVQTAPDNVIKLNDDPAAFGLDADSRPRAVLVMGGSNGRLSVYAKRDIQSAEELRGQALGVDNPASGFALVLRDLLARAGLLLDRDYAFVVAGSTDARCEKLLRGETPATILYMPFDLRAEAAGCACLARSTEHYAAYASVALAGMRGWLDEHPDLATRYIRAILGSVRWIYDPANAEAVRRILREEPALALDVDLAREAYAAFTAPDTGFGREAALDLPGLRQVISIRQRFGNPRGTLAEPEAYCDARYYEAARASM